MRSSTPPTALCLAAAEFPGLSTGLAVRACWKECRALRRTTYPQGLRVGEAVATGAGNLPARWLIHAVGPNRHAGQTDPALLESCFKTSIREAVNVGARSVAFPAISSGVFGWDIAEVARIAVAELRGSPHLGELDLVRFVPFSRASHEAFIAALGQD
jgi:O-acetyl-ADP-ribose deacetylase (regulator of RNase III)